MANNDQSGKLAGGCLMLFALPFAAVGVFMSVLMVTTWLEHREAKDWIETPAGIVATDLKAHHGDDSTTYEVTAEYTYVYQDREYRGNRVSLHSGADNIGSFHQDAHRDLSQHQQSGKPFRCYVDPDNPAEAILYRELRWQMMTFYSLFAVTFGSVGFGLLVGAFFTVRNSRACRALADAHPAEPWRWKPGWVDGRIRSSNRRVVRIVWAVAIAWNVVSIPLAGVVGLVLLGELHEGNWWALLGLIVPAIGLILLSIALYNTLRWQRFGESVFEMASVPGVVGGKLAGVVRIQADLRPADGFRLRLIRVHRHTTRSGNKNSTTERIAWEDERVILYELDSDDYSRTVIPVLFGIPYDEIPSTIDDSNNKHIWRLEVTADVPGVDYKAKFEVPVFKTDQSSPDFQLDDSPIAAYAAPVDLERQLNAAGIRRFPSPTANGTRFVFTMARNPGTALSMTLTLALFVGIVIVMLHLKAPILFPIIFGFFGLLILWIALDLWFTRTTVDVSPDGIGVRGGLFGLGRHRWIDADDITEITTKSNMQSGQSTYHSILLRGKAGKRTNLGSHVKGKLQAKAVIEAINEARLGTSSRPGILG